MKKPNSVVKDRPTLGRNTWPEVERVLLSKFHEPDIEAAKVLFACVAAHKIETHPPAWLLMIAPPGSMKTELLETLKDASGSVHFVDEVTANTFISGKCDEPGKPKQGHASLLHRIGKEGIFVSADFGTVMSMNRRVRSSVLAQLRRIYDGHISREFGTDENLNERTWEGRLTLLAGATPEVDKYHSIFTALGERFLRIRWNRAGGADAALRAMRQTEVDCETLRKAVQSFLAPVLNQPSIKAPEAVQEYLEQIAALSELVVRARADVPRDRYSRGIEGEPVIESNTRFPQQLAQVARGWAVLSGRAEVKEEDYTLAVRVAFNSIPPVRSKVLDALRRDVSPYSSDAPNGTVERALEDLGAAGLVKQTKLSSLARDLLQKAGLENYPQCNTHERAGVCDKAGNGQESEAMEGGLTRLRHRHHSVFRVKPLQDNPFSESIFPKFKETRLHL